jgi:hypothetical protein
MLPMNRVIFLVDGFNVYHSVLDASRDLGGVSTKWLNLYSLCKSYLQQIGTDAKIERIYYFSAFAEHLLYMDPDIVDRHKAYIKCLQSTSVVEQMGRFKPKVVKCKVCSNYFTKNEEKETDVAIGSKLLEILFLDCCDTVVIVTGDTDILPAIHDAMRLFPNIRILSLFPYKRKNKDLAKIVHRSFKIKKDAYLRHQFPDPVTLPDGTTIHKPQSW